MNSFYLVVFQGGFLEYQKLCFTLSRSVGDAIADATPPAAIPAAARFTTRTCNFQRQMKVEKEDGGNEAITNQRRQLLDFAASYVFRL